MKIHISDWNMNDRVIEVDDKRAAEIIVQTAATATERMRMLYDAAKSNGAVSLDPRASELEEAEIFLSWPGPAMGFVPDGMWDSEFCEEIQLLKTKL